MMPVTTDNTAFPINKSPSSYLCCKCTIKPADYYVLTGNLKAPSEMRPLCDTCYNNNQPHLRKRTTTTWYSHQHPRNGEVRTILAASVNKILTSYVQEVLHQSA